MVKDTLCNLQLNSYVLYISPNSLDYSKCFDILNSKLEYILFSIFSEIIKLGEFNVQRYNGFLQTLKKQFFNLSTTFQFRIFSNVWWIFLFVSLIVMENLFLTPNSAPYFLLNSSFLWVLQVILSLYLIAWKQFLVIRLRKMVRLTA